MPNLASENESSNTSHPSSSTKSTTRGNALVRLCVLLGLLASIVTLFSFGASYHWSLDLLVNMRSQLALGLAIVVVPLAVFQKWRHVLVFTICCAINLADVVPLYLPAESSPPSGPSPADGSSSDLTVLSANVLSSNANKQGYIDYLRNQQADLVLLLELDVEWARIARELADEYPYQLVRPRGDNFGLALLSRYELVDARLDPLSSGLPTIIADVQVGEPKITVIGTHPLPPIGTARFKSRNTQLLAVAEKVRDAEYPVILCGDLNVTPWSPAFKNLLDHSGLRDARKGFGLQSTWPAKPWPIAIPIDHVLVSPSISVTSFSAGPLIGSDHRPVRAELKLPR